MSKVGPTNRAGLVTVVQGARALLSLVAAALLFTNCSTPGLPDGSAPLNTAVDDAPTVPASPAGSMHADTYRWPKEGWFRLELDAELDLGDRQSVRWRAGAAGWWRDGRFEWWSDALSPSVRPSTRYASASWRTACRLERDLAAGKVATPPRRERRVDGCGVESRRRFVGGRAMGDRTGALPWDTDGPFAARS